MIGAHIKRSKLVAAHPQLLQRGHGAEVERGQPIVGSHEVPHSCGIAKIDLLHLIVLRNEGAQLRQQRFHGNGGQLVAGYDKAPDSR